MAREYWDGRQIYIMHVQGRNKEVLKYSLALNMVTVTNKSVKEISYELGFQSIHYFSRLFKNKVGKSPSEFRR